MMSPRASTRVFQRMDVVLMACFFLILMFGLVMLTSASAAVGYSRAHDSYYFIKRQLAFGVLPGIAGFLFFLSMEYHALKKFGIPLFIASLVLLLAVFIPGIGSRLNTAHRSWIALGPVSIQPVEFVKFALIVFLAGVLHDMGGRVSHFTTGFLPAFGLGALPLILVLLQPDIGSAIILFAIVFGMFFASGASWRHLTALALLGIAAFAILTVAAPYRAARVTTFLHPELDPKGIGYQINQSFLAIGSGGWWGLGLGHSRQKFQFLPEVEADSIFAVIAEEMGFLVSAFFLVCLLILTLRGFRVAARAPDSFGTLLVSGMMIWFLSQSFVNMGGIAGLLPFTGVPLPFVSHGGTALAMALAGVGVIASVSAS